MHARPSLRIILTSSLDALRSVTLHYCPLDDNHHEHYAHQRPETPAAKPVPPKQKLLVLHCLRTSLDDLAALHLLLIDALALVRVGVRLRADA